jgi:hypothetical protein
MRFIDASGRQFTDYNPNCELNRAIQRKNNITNSHEYRAFLQKNAEELMKNFSKSVDTTEGGCKFCPVCQAAMDA